MERAAGQLPVRARGLAAGLARRRDQARVERDRLDPPHRLRFELASALRRHRLGRGAGSRRASSASSSGLGVPQVDEQLGLTRRPRSGSRAAGQRAGGRHAGVAACDLLHPQSQLGRGKAGVAAAVHRRRPGVRGLAAEPEAVALDPGAAADRGGPQALRLEHRPLLDVQLEVGGEPPLAARRLRREIQIDAVLRQHLGEPAALAIAQVPHLGGVEGPRERGAAEQAAPEARALLVGPVDQRQGPRRADARLRTTP